MWLDAVRDLGSGHINSQWFHIVRAKLGRGVSKMRFLNEANFFGGKVENCQI